MLDAPLDRVAGPLAIAGGITLAIAAFLVLRALRRGGASRVEHDEGAATSTGHAIENALAAPWCASAHAVSTIARAGCIDHLVATPVRLWVIGAMHRRVPREELPGVLERIADNTTAIWNWAPPGTPVRGCLVLRGRIAPRPQPIRLRQGARRGAHPRHARARAQGRSEARARARRACRGRGVEASSGVRIARSLDVAWTYGPPWRAESPVSEFPHHNRSPPSTRAQPVPLSRTMRGSSAANAVSCAGARQPATTCERSRPRVRSSGPEP